MEVSVQPSGSWQALAVELIRRRSGAAPAMSIDELRAAGARQDLELLKHRMDGAYFLACPEVEHPRRRLYQMLWELQVRAAKTLIDELAKLGVSPVAFKGLELGARYDGTGLGLREDVDLLVPVDALWDVKKTLNALGYFNGAYDPGGRTWVPIDYFKAVRHEANAYELVEFVQKVRVDGPDDDVRGEARRFPSLFRVEDAHVTVFVRFDVHHNVLFNFDVAPLMARSIPGALGVARALAPADHLWFLIHRYYYEVAIGAIRSPRVLALIAPVVNDPDVDWDLVVRNAVGMRTTAPCLYWLTFFHKLGAPRVPTQVLTQLAAHRRSERNWGWQLGRLFDVTEPFPEALLTMGSEDP